MAKVELVAELRRLTNLGLKECVDAIKNSGNDLEKALENLKQRGLQISDKKMNSDRTTKEGVIEVYQHFNKQIAVMVEVNCETDFVAKTPDFQNFAKDIAKHIAVFLPVAIEIPSNLPSYIADQYDPKDYLMTQPFYTDYSITVGELVRQCVAKLGEKIVIKRFVIFRLDEDSDEALIKEK